MRENDERERTNREKVHKSVSEMSENAQQEFSKVFPPRVFDSKTNFLLDLSDLTQSRRAQ